MPHGLETKDRHATTIRRLADDRDEKRDAYYANPNSPDMDSWLTAEEMVMAYCAFVKMTEDEAYAR